MRPKPWNIQKPNWRLTNADKQGYKLQVMYVDVEYSCIHLQHDSLQGLAIRLRVKPELSAPN